MADVSNGFLAKYDHTLVTPNGVAEVTGWLSNSNWVGCFDLVSTTWAECASDPFTSWTDCYDFPVSAVQSITASNILASGTYVLNFDGQATAAIAFDATASEIADALSELDGMSYVGVNGGFDIGTPRINLALYGFYGAAPLFTITANTTGETFTVATTTDGEATVWTEVLI